MKLLVIIIKWLWTWCISIEPQQLGKFHKSLSSWVSALSSSESWKHVFPIPNTSKHFSNRNASPAVMLTILKCMWSERISCCQIPNEIFVTYTLNHYLNFGESMLNKMEEYPLLLTKEKTRSNVRTGTLMWNIWIPSTNTCASLTIPRL